MTHINVKKIINLEQICNLESEESCVDEEHVIGDYIKGYKLYVAIPLHLVDHVFVPVHVKEKLDWLLVLAQLIPLKITILNDYYRNRGIDTSLTQEENGFFEIVFINNIPQQSHDILLLFGYVFLFLFFTTYMLHQGLSYFYACICRAFLLHSQGISVGIFDADFLRSRYAALLGNMGNIRLMSEP
ncbi:hypothetical protein H5410_032822 [Solanum commersonii]|uniref:Uncharacterized protein n=1 Tax=Solanum commersonii TaxID=4109 RepID=A0A9J5YQR2_SOLCO|nr:hypothetical protein H5410_032822 [Solanum commersonii]